jgi:aspartyl-tRNA(Asn)/glutamyl-tRNA(Gln) amidotransferase subunit C
LAVKLTLEQVRHVAELARLGLTDDEMERLTGELSKILDYVDQLEQLDTSAVEPTAQVGGLVDIFRADEVEPSLPLEAALANAPARDGGYFRVRAMQE